MTTLEFEINHRSERSRGEAVLRGFLGAFYIGLPHGIAMLLFNFLSMVVLAVTWWVVLFTGQHPRGWFDFQVGLLRWRARLAGTFYQLVDGYPAFGTGGAHQDIELNVTYPETLSKGTNLLKIFIPVYVLMPHGFCLGFRSMGTMILTFLGWWSILFTGRVPEGWHRFNVGTIRWALRVMVYISFMSDEYPRFSGKP